MNKLVSTKRLRVKIATIFAASLIISACAGTNIVSQEPTVKQLFDLNDYDRDGVIKAREQCPGTILGATIDNYGCGTKITIDEPFRIDIKFTNNSFVIPQEAFAKVEQLADFLEQNPNLNVLIEGHTSIVGSASLNQTLSENRANAVRESLIADFDIEPDRVFAEGYGFSRLAVSGNTEDAHAANRRILVNLSRTKETYEMLWTIYTVDEVE